MIAVTPTMTAGEILSTLIRDLLATPEPFREWLHNQPLKLAYEPDCPTGCFLHAFLLDNGAPSDVYVGSFGLTLHESRVEFSAVLGVDPFGDFWATVFQGEAMYAALQETQKGRYRCYREMTILEAIGILNTIDAPDK